MMFCVATILLAAFVVGYDAKVNAVEIAAVVTAEHGYLLGYVQATRVPYTFTDGLLVFQLRESKAMFQLEGSDEDDAIVLKNTSRELGNLNRAWLRLFKDAPNLKFPK